MTAPIILNLLKILAPSLSNLTAMMSKQEVMKIGDITFTLEALVETLIANEPKKEKKENQDLITDNSPHPPL